MKLLLGFAAGAVVAAGLMYMAVGRRETPPTPVTATEVSALPPAPTEPVGTPLPPPQSAPPEGAGSGGFRPVPNRPARAAAQPPANASAQPQASQVPPANPVSTPPAAPSQPEQPAAETRANAVAPQQAPEKPVRKAQTVTIGAGTLVSVRLNETLSTERNHEGDTFTATLDSPLVVDGLVIAERGSKLDGKIVRAEKGGRVRGGASLALELTTLATSDGQRVNLETDTFEKVAADSTKGDVAKVGAAAGIGAAIGAIAGGGKGAAIGAVIGGATGTGGVLATRGRAAELPVETRISFRVKEAVTVTEKLR